MHGFSYMSKYSSPITFFSDAPHTPVVMFKGFYDEGQPHYDFALYSNYAKYKYNHNINVGERMTAAVSSNPRNIIYIWKNTTTNKIIAMGSNITVTEKMLGKQSFNIVACNTIPIPSPHTACCDLTIYVTVASKCVSFRCVSILCFFQLQI